MQGIMDADVLVHWAARGSDTPEDAVQMLHDLMVDALEGSWCDQDTIKIAVKGKGNYRKDVAENYKANRKELDADLKARLAAVHSTLLKEYGGIQADGMEADDLVRIWALECIEAGEDFIIIAEDKDLKCIPGRHYNPKKKIIEWIDEDAADLLYHQQLLTGDSADNIKGLYRVGPKKAQAYLKDCAPGKERMDKVTEVWQERGGDTWYEDLEVCAKLITILPTHDFVFNLEDHYAREEEDIQTEV